MELDEAIKKRHSSKRYKKKKPDWRKIVEALDLARLAPLAGNTPVLKFMLIKDKNKIKKLAKAAQQDFIADAKYVVAIFSNPERMESFDSRGEKYLKQEVGAAIENFLLKLTDLGLSTCWVGAFVDRQVKQILKVPKNIDVEALFPIGIERKKGKQKTKSDLGSLLYFDTWGQKKMK